MIKKEILNFLNNKNTYDKVLNIIEGECQSNGTTLYDYDEEVFLSGGAVANTIYYLLNQGRLDKPVINDVDLFYFNKNEFNQFIPPVENSFIGFTVNNTLNVDGYGRTWWGSNGEYVYMYDSERIGVINKVQLMVHSPFSDFDLVGNYKRLINNFDLNCTSAGIDRVNEKIIYNDNFINFLITNKIEVTNVDQPLQTCVRMYKKSKELQTDTSNFDSEVLLLQHSFLYHNPRYIGPLWVEKSKDYEELLGKYFKPVEQFGDDSTNYTTNQFVITHNDFFHFYTRDAIINFWNLFVRKKDQDNTKKLIDFCQRYLGLNFSDEQVMWPLKLQTITPRTTNFFVNCLEISAEYFDCEFTYEDLILVHEFFTKVNSIENISTLVVKNIEQQKRFIKYFDKKFVNNYGEVRTKLLTNMIYKSRFFNKKERMLMSSLDVDTRVASMDKLLSLWWLKKNGWFQPHRFQPTCF